MVTKISYPDDTHGTQFPAGTCKTFGFDQSGNKIWEENELGKRTNYQYDDYGRVTSVTDPVGNVTTNSYLPWGKTSSYLTTSNLPFVTTVPVGRATNKTINTYYDANWRKKRVQEAPGTSVEANTWFGYDYVGNQTYVTDPLGSGDNDPVHTVTTTYDNRNRKRQVTDPQAHATIYGYDFVGNVISITRPDTSVVLKEYDHMNRVTKDTTPKNGPANAPTSSIVAQFKYYLGKDNQMCGELEKLIDGEGRATKFTYWPFGLKKEMFYPLDNAGNVNSADYQAWTYDSNRNLASRRTVNNETQSFTYDSRNRKTAMTWSNSADYANFAYDAAGRLTNADNATSAIVRDYTDAGELMFDSQNIAGLGAKVVNYAYTKTKQTRLYATGASYDYTFGYDEMGRFSTIAPTGSAVAFQYGYDRASNETQRTNNLNSVVQLTPRDNLNRMTRRDVKLGANVLSYEEYGYDVMSRLNQVDREDSLRDNFGYDLSGQLVNATYGTPLATPTPTPTPTATPTPTITPTPTPTATPSNQCAPVTFSTTGGYPSVLKVYMSTATSGATIFYTIGNSSPANPTHNGNTATGSTVKYTGPVNVNVGQHKFFKAIAYKAGMTDSVITTFEAENTNNCGQFAPMSSMSLLSSGGPRVVTYNLDKAGNRTGTNGVVDDGVAKNYVPNPLNQYSTAEGEGVVNGPHHELTSFQAVNYTYINDERLKTVTSGSNTYQLAYDALGRCVKRTLNSATTYYVYDGEKPILEYSSAGALVAANLYGKEIDEILMRSDYTIVPTRILYYQDDHEGSVTHLTNNSGAIIETYRYDAFGAPKINGGTNTSSPLGNRFMFTGREYASTFSIYEYRARAYHPSIGRFMSEDPKLYVRRIGLGAETNKWSFLDHPDDGELNLFRYSGNDPLDYTDPMGEAPEWLHTTLDVTGVLEPTPFSDLTNAALYGGEGNWGQAGVSVAGVLPYLGDLGKAGRLSGKTARFLTKLQEARIAEAFHWGKPGKLADHFERHGADFGARNAADYAKKASDFLQQSQKAGLPTKVDKSGVIRTYDPKTNTFGAYNRDGTTRTLFKPEEGAAYFEKQPGQDMVFEPR